MLKVSFENTWFSYSDIKYCFYGLTELRARNSAEHNIKKIMNITERNNADKTLII